MEHEISPWVIFAMSALVIVGLSLYAIISTRRLSKIPTGTNQKLLEVIVSALDNFVVGIIGPEGGKYTPLVGTIFIYVLVSSLLGLIPFFKSATSSLNITASLALIVFFMYNYYGVKQVGFLNYFKHLLGEPLWLAPLMFPIHVIGELARPLSLSIRLFGNIFGEETIIAILAAMSFVLLRIHGIPVLVVPVQFPMMAFAIFTSFVQAMVFAMLTAIYIGIAISGHESEHE